MIEPATSQALQLVMMDDEPMYKIMDVQTMRPFFMTIVSDSDHWLFVSSNGGISAGRKNSSYALFPYYTDDKIIDGAEVTGSKTLIRLVKDGRMVLWEPFSVRSESSFQFSRHLYQNRLGNKLVFEEVNHDLQLVFQYTWCTSDVFGFVKHARLLNQSDKSVTLEVVDGLQNLLPYGIPNDLQVKSSNLADAYKRSELAVAAGIGMYALSAIIVDKAEPSEALKANIAWSTGFDATVHLLSALQLPQFRKGAALSTETDMKGERGAYFVGGTLQLAPQGVKDWMIVSNVNQTHASIVELMVQHSSGSNMRQLVMNDIRNGSTRLLQLVAAADGVQCTADHLKDSRHYSNVLFNIMRGGIFDQNYDVDKQDLIRFLQKANTSVFEKTNRLLDTLGSQFTIFDLKVLAAGSGDADFIRLTTEYLPLKFSRRHGDPSRPWNQFSINTRNETDGSKVLDYEGNWRDIFQNWEALAHAYPGFIEGMIYKFLNASTFDGYNPYRVTKDGFDWETIEPDNPWSYIGYWGDHQIIYLLKFLEFAEQRQPGALAAMLSRSGFVYAHVPYRIKPYADIVRNPKDTIAFDSNSEKLIHGRMQTIGSDGALLLNAMGAVHQVGFLEKILATVLSKLSNFIPEGGIWMNTQRPEWNDANNALVGNGVSMVTLYYLRRFLKFLQQVLLQTNVQELSLSTELHGFFTNVATVFSNYRFVLNRGITDELRKEITDALGTAGSSYRSQIYEQGFSGAQRHLDLQALHLLVEQALGFLDHSIRANKRSDALYHAYNLMTYDTAGIRLSHLSEMLEGQVAVLSSGILTAGESVQLLDALQQSSLYRADQNSFLLYPNKLLPGFLQKNVLDQNKVETSVLLCQLRGKGIRTILEEDCNGHFHFNGNFRNAADLQQALSGLPQEFQPLVAREQQQLLQLFEEVFNHKEFTGRSGTFFGYEGLGSIYWHMVSKLLLAVSETCLQALDANADSGVIERLLAHYNNIYEGIGVHKPPQVYGAFPITPYSHTPLHRGAQQPGMTGQVKEDILTRIQELGVFIKHGQLVFQPRLLQRKEFSTEPLVATVIGVDGSSHNIQLEKDSLLFTYCQTPVVYMISDSEGVTVERRDGSKSVSAAFELDMKDTQSVLCRTGEVQLIQVFLQQDRLR